MNVEIKDTLERKYKQNIKGKYCFHWVNGQWSASGKTNDEIFGSKVKEKTEHQKNRAIRTERLKTTGQTSLLTYSQTIAAWKEWCDGDVTKKEIAEKLAVDTKGLNRCFKFMSERGADAFKFQGNEHSKKYN